MPSSCMYVLVTMIQQMQVDVEVDVMKYARSILQHHCLASSGRLHGLGAGLETA